MIGFLFLQERSSPCTAKSAPESIVWVLIKYYDQYGGARTILEVTRPWCVCVGKPLFQNDGPITQNQSLHLHIDYRTRMIPISVIPVQIWRCEDWIFLVKTEIQSPHHHICTGIHNMRISRVPGINTKVQGPY